MTRGKGVRPFGEHVDDLIPVYFAEITSVFGLSKKSQARLTSSANNLSPLAVGAMPKAMPPSQWAWMNKANTPLSDREVLENVRSPADMHRYRRCSATDVPRSGMDVRCAGRGGRGGMPDSGQAVRLVMRGILGCRAGRGPLAWAGVDEPPRDCAWNRCPALGVIAGQAARGTGRRRWW